MLVQVKIGTKHLKFAFSSRSPEGTPAIFVYFCMFPFNSVCFLLVMGWGFYVTKRLLWTPRRGHGRWSHYWKWSPQSSVSSGSLLGSWAQAQPRTTESKSVL